MKKMNILYIIWSLGLGGAEEVVISLAKGLDKSVYNSEVLCLNNTGIRAGELEREGIKVLALNKSKKIDFSIIGKIVRVIRDEQIDIVHTHLWGANFWGRIAARIAGVPVTIVTEHNVDVWKNFIHRIADIVLAFFTDKVIVVSKKVKEFYSRWGICEKKLHTIYNGIDIDRFAADKETVRKRFFEEFGLKDNRVITTVGRLAQAKDHITLLKAFQKIRGRLDNAKLFIVGDGPLRSKLEEFCKMNNLSDAVILTGYRADIPYFLAASDIFTLSSTREGHPLTVLEAMASRTPVVITAVGGNAEIIESGVNGFLVKPKSPGDLSEAIIEVLENSTIQQDFTKKAYQKVQSEFSVTQMIEEHEKLYCTLLKNIS